MNEIDLSKREIIQKIELLRASPVEDLREWDL